MNQFGGAAKRSHEIVERIAGLQMSHYLGSRSHHLEYDRDGSLLSVIITDRKGNPLGIPVCPYNHKLPRLAGFGNSFRFHHHQIYIGGKFFCF